MTAMIPTQSVCKHCAQDISQTVSGWRLTKLPFGLFCHAEMLPEQQHEPVAEPAGEQTKPRKFVFDDFCEGCVNQMACSIKGRCIVPSAPQTSAIIGKGYIELDQMIENLAAPQPVSGDAPKVEEIARKIANSIIRPLLHAANDGKKISLNFLDEVALETEAILRPYFASAPTQKPTSPEDVPDLYRLAYMPGVWRCLKCGFVLSKATISMSSASIGTTPEDRQSEQCPNDREWMLPVTYKESLKECQDRLLAELGKPQTPAAEIVGHLIWALDIMKMYEGRLIQFGDPPDLVYSDVHKKRVAEAQQSIWDAAKYVEFRVPNIETRNPKE